MDDMNDALNLLKLLQKTKNIDPNDMIPCLSCKDIKRTINDDKNKTKLILILFIESSNPVLNLLHVKLNPITKKSRMVLAYYVDIKEDMNNIISDYKLKQSISLILFKGGKEIQRFEGMPDQDAFEYIDKNTPMDPFGGGSHKISDMDKVDTEEYWKSVRRPKQAPPPPQPQNKPKKHSRYDEFMMRNNLGPSVPQNAPPPPPPSPPKAQTQTIPFLNPFSEEYKTLKSDLENIPFRQDEIEKSIIAGCAELNESYTYIENIRNNQPNNEPLTYPGFNIDDLPPQQREIFDKNSEVDENGESMLDTVQVLYVLLYTGVEDEDDLVDYYGKANNGEPIPSKQPINSTSNVDLELQRILGQTAPPQQSFSNTAPIYSQGFLDPQAQRELKKEYDEAKKKREDELNYKRKTLEAIKKQRENQKREIESQAKASNNQFSKTAPVNIKQATQSSPKTKGNSKTAIIRFQLPNGTATNLEFETTNTFDDIERKLKEDNHINEADLIEFNIVPFTRVVRSDFGLQLQDKNVRGKVAMSVIILQPQEEPPQPQEEPPEE